MKKQFFAKMLVGCSLIASVVSPSIAEQTNTDDTNANARFRTLEQEDPNAINEDIAVPIISVRSQGPKAIESDQTATYNVNVRNISSKKDASVKVVITYPKSAGFVDAQPSPEFVREGAIEYTIPNLARLTEQDLKITLSPPKDGNMGLNVVCSLKADNNLQTIVKRPNLQFDFDGPPVGSVGMSIPMEVSVKNVGDGIVRGVYLFSELPEGISLDEQSTEDLLKSFDIKGGVTKKVKFNVLAAKEGGHNLQFQVYTANMPGKMIQTGIHVIKPTLDVHFAGPSMHVVNQSSDYTLVIENNTRHAIEGAELDLEVPGALSIEKVSRYGDYFKDQWHGIHMVWPIMKVEPGKRMSIRLRAKALTEFKADCGIQLRFKDGSVKNISYSIGAVKGNASEIKTAQAVDLTDNRTAKLPSSIIVEGNTKEMVK